MHAVRGGPKYNFPQRFRLAIPVWCVKQLGTWDRLAGVVVQFSVLITLRVMNFLSRSERTTLFWANCTTTLAGGGWAFGGAGVIMKDWRGGQLRDQYGRRAETKAGDGRQRLGGAAAG